METIITYKCLNCGGGLRFDPNEQDLICDFCMSKFTEEELEKEENSKKSEEKERQRKEFDDSVKEYYCDSCGAAVIADNNTAADFCYYCHHPLILGHKLSGNLRPTKIVPFKFNRNEAKDKFIQYAKKKWFLPRDYISSGSIEKITGVYYPFWVTDADTDSEMQGIGKNIRTWMAGDYRYTETTTYAVYRRGRLHFEDITTSAISTEDKKMIEGILPYPVEDYTDFSMPYLQGYFAKKRDIERESLSGEVKSRMNSYANTLLTRTTNYSVMDVNHLDVSILHSHWEYSLMPIWILTYKKKHETKKNKDRMYIYAMNGSTGKVYGELPVSIPKLLLASLGAAVGAALLGLLAGFLFIL